MVEISSVGGEWIFLERLNNTRIEYYLASTINILHILKRFNFIGKTGVIPLKHEQTASEFCRLQVHKQMPGIQNTAGEFCKLQLQRGLFFQFIIILN